MPTPTARPTAACYLRVSTSDGRQTVENQRAPLAQLCEQRGWRPRWYEEQESAAKSRPVFERMLADAHRGELVAVAVVALDRLGRSLPGVMETVAKLDAAKVEVVSLREPWLDMRGPTRGLLVAIVGWVGELERATLIERTKAGLARARRQGVRLGRPPASPVLLSSAAELVKRGEPIARAARLKGVKATTLRRFLAR